MPNEEQDLLQVFREGAPEAFEKIVLKYQGPLMGFFFRLCWDRFLAEDLTQEVFLRMIKAAQSYKPSGKLDYFVFRIARNLWIDRVRKRSLRPKP
ncbi:MAG TPA: sigma-70 family RNA polymerase sigma factor, partial [Planctomycetes bacterium]|nr:sigma-70 family RNA polymerase sigma factor [Planctomycetota bacterium]